MFYLKSFSKKSTVKSNVYVKDFSKGISSAEYKTLTPLYKASYSFNTLFESGAIKGGNGIKKADFGNYKTPEFKVGSLKPKRLYYYKRYDQNKKAYLDYLLIYANDGNIYKAILGTDTTFSLIQDCNFEKEPTAVTYTYAGEDVIIFSIGYSMKVYNGSKVTSITDAPGINSMCIHNERLFATEGEAKTKLWFSDDFDPLNWNLSLQDAGYIDLRDGRGSLIKVLSFEGYVYVFRNYGISRITAYGDQTGFSVDGVTASSGKIYADSIAVCGDRIIYLAQDGFYSFNGSSTTKIINSVSGLIEGVDNSACRAIYFNGKYYCMLNFKEDNGEIFKGALRYDLNSGNFVLTRNMPFADFVVLEGEKYFKLLFLNADNRLIGELSEKSEYFGEPVKKTWQSGESDFGVRKIKSLTRFYINTKTPVKVRIKADNQSAELYFNGSELRQSKPVGIKGEYFSIYLECETPECLISYLSADFEYDKG